MGDQKPLEICEEDIAPCQKSRTVKMRIPIREQLGLLVCFVSLMALMVLSLAVVRSSIVITSIFLLTAFSGFKVTTSS